MNSGEILLLIYNIRIYLILNQNILKFYFFKVYPVIYLTDIIMSIFSIKKSKNNNKMHINRQKVDRRLYKQKYYVCYIKSQTNVSVRI